MSRKGENIYKRKDGRWEGRYIAGRTKNGKAVYKSVYARSYTLVKQKMQQIKTDSNIRNICPDTEKNHRTFASFLWEWLDFVKPRIKESSYVRYANLIEHHMEQQIGKHFPEDIDTRLIDDYINTLLRKKENEGAGLSAKTAADILGVTKSVIQYIDSRYKPLHCDLSQITIKKEEARMRILSREEQEVLVRYLLANPSRMNVGILLTLFTGLRIGELCALRWSDIRIEERVICVERTMQRIQNRRENRHTGQETDDLPRKTKIIITTPKSSKSIRKIPLPDQISQILKAGKCCGSEYFLTGKEQSYIEPRTMQYHFKKVLKQARVPEANYHALRHTFATRCVELGFDIKSLSEILGHASVNITLNRYVHPSMDVKKDNMEKLAFLIAV